LDILNSDWLINMLKKSSKTPHGRLLSLFEVLDDWLDLLSTAQPNIADQIRARTATASNSHQLQDYLTIEAAKAGAAMPEMLANQLYFMAISAAQERLHANTPGHPLSNSLHAFDSPCNHSSFIHAKSAAHALIIAQTKQEFHISKSTAYGIAASFLGVLVVTGALYSNQNADPRNTQSMNQVAKKNVAVSMPIQAAIPQLVSAENLADPEQTAALMAQIELMRHGNCQLIEALQLPDQYKGIYLDMVVNGQVSTDQKEQKIAFALLKQTRCNYTPMLMANSK
jgi:hypothetical protein